MTAQTSGAALVILRDGRSYAADQAHFDAGVLHAHARRRQLVGTPEDREVLLGEERGYSWPRETLREVRWADAERDR